MKLFQILVSVILLASCSNARSDSNGEGFRLDDKCYDLSDYDDLYYPRELDATGSYSVCRNGLYKKMDVTIDSVKRNQGLYSIMSFESQNFMPTYVFYVKRRDSLRCDNREVFSEHTFCDDELFNKDDQGENEVIISRYLRLNDTLDLVLKAYYYGIHSRKEIDYCRIKKVFNSLIISDSVNLSSVNSDLDNIELIEVN